MAIAHIHTQIMRLGGEEIVYGVLLAVFALLAAPGPLAYLWPRLRPWNGRVMPDTETEAPATIPVPGSSSDIELMDAIQIERRKRSALERIAAFERKAA